MDNELLLNTDLDLILIKDDIEISEVKDQDLMRVKCFATHEGINGNNVEFPRSVLKNCYSSFIDKPVFIEIKNGMPNGHGFDYKKKTFSSKDRKQIGHIVNAYPCIVDSEGKIHDVSYMEEQNYPDGEFRIICDLVVYKSYESEIAELLAKLHILKNLKFSMESICNYVITDDGIKHCTSIHFTGLSIVKTPAFENSYSLEVAEKEENLMDFEKLYNEEHARVETLVAEKTTLEAEKTTLSAEKTKLENDLVTVNEELAEAKGKLVEANAEIDTLKPYKEKIENAEKLEVGQKRLDKLSKYGYKEKTAQELAEVSNEDYISLLETATDNYNPTELAENRIIALPSVDTKLKSNNKGRLLSLLDELGK